jgi:hypothetical protein
MPFAFALMLLAGTDFGLDPAWKPVADPLAAARAGQVQCLDPDPAARTCRGMAWFDVRADGGVQVRQITILANMPAMAAEVRFPLKREGAALCGMMTEAHIANHRIVSSRAPFAPVRDEQLYLVYREALVATLLNRKLCSYHYTRDGDALGQEVGTIDGQFAGELMSLYSWIDPKAGWRLKAPG